MADKFVRWSEGYSIRYEESSISGKEVYRRDDAHADAVVFGGMPVVGTTQMLNETGSAVTGCRCRTKDVKFLEGDMGTVEYTFSFSTKSGSGSSPDSTDVDSRRFDLAGEIHQVENPSSVGWTWPNGDPIEQPLFLRIVTGKFTIPKRVANAAKNNFIGSVIPFAGRINLGTFEGFADGQVLFTGLSGNDETNSDGNREWVFTLQFEFRVIPALLNPGNDWNHLWRKTGSWSTPKDANGKFLYEAKDMSELVNL